MTISESLLKLRDAARLRHFALATERAYCFWLQSYMQAVTTFPNHLSSEQKVKRFLTDQARRGVAASTQNQALNALVFFYEAVLGTPLGEIDAARARRPVRIRTALSVEETRTLLETVEDVAGYPTRLVAWMLYGCGMRVSEPLQLRIKDVNLPELKIIIRGAKGGKDRVANVPVALVSGLEAQLRVARAVWRGDLAAEMPVAMPGLQGTKSPRLAFAEAWAWVFPAHSPTLDPRTGREMRWRMHEVNIQRAVRAAAARTGLAGKVTPHGLRHSYATHAHRDGASARDLQEILGHVHLDTTMRYLEPAAAGVPSPLDRLISGGKLLAGASASGAVAPGS